MTNFSSYTYVVRATEVDFRGLATLPALVNFLQESAWHNAAEIGASVYRLMEEGVSWVMNRMHLEIVRLPRHLEKVSVETWASGKDRFFAYRDYEVFDEEGNSLVKATSSWIVFDIKTRKLTPVPGWLADLGPKIDRVALPRWSEKLRIPAVCVHHVPISTGWHDLDMNRHVNNIRYFQWVVESLPLDFLAGHQLTGISIILKAEALAGELLETCAEPTVEGTFLHKIINPPGKVLVEARTHWKAVDTVLSK